MEHVGELTGTSAGERHRQFLSHQLFWDMQSMIEGFIGLVEYREQRWGGCAGVRARSCSQDSLESLFGRLRMACGSGQAVSMIKAVHRLCHERMLAQRHDGPLERQRTLVAPALLLRSRQAALDFLMPSGSSCLPVLKQLGTRCSPAHMPQHYGQSFGLACAQRKQQTKRRSHALLISVLVVFIGSLRKSTSTRRASPG